MARRVSRVFHVEETLRVPPGMYNWVSRGRRSPAEYFEDWFVRPVAEIAMHSADHDGPADVVETVLRLEDEEFMLFIADLVPVLNTYTAEDGRPQDRSWVIDDMLYSRRFDEPFAHAICREATPRFREAMSDRGWELHETDFCLGHQVFLLPADFGALVVQAPPDARPREATFAAYGLHGVRSEYVVDPVLQGIGVRYWERFALLGRSVRSLVQINFV